MVKVVLTLEEAEMAAEALDKMGVVSSDVGAAESALVCLRRALRVERALMTTEDLMRVLERGGECDVQV